MYIIRQTRQCNNRYFIRETLGLISWGSHPGSAAQYKTEEEAKVVCSHQLKDFSCEVVAIVE